MTTIVYTGKILAADSRSTHYHNNEIECPDCGHSFDRIHRPTTKIQILDKPFKFQGIEVVATAASGLRNLSDVLLKAMQDGIDPVSFVKHAKSLGNSVYLNDTCSILLVGRDAAIEVRKDAKVTVKKVEEFPFIAGSGRVAAVLYYKLMGDQAQPVDAIRTAAVADKSTGGEIHSLDLTAETLSLETVQVEAEEERELQFVRQKLATVLVPPRAPRAPRVRKEPFPRIMGGARESKKRPKAE